MKQSPEVDRWFEEVKPPAAKALQRARQVILKADRRITEYIKYGSVIFGYRGDCVSFVQYRKPTVNLMFHRGAKIPGKFAHLEGSGPTARFMRFKDAREVDKRAVELGKIVKAWCDLMDTGKTKPL